MDSINYNRQMLQTGFMVMDPFTGAVKAWVGGIDFRTYKFDHVNLSTKRQVGSSIKPFLYSLAIEDFNFTPATSCPAIQQFFPEYNDYVPAKAGSHWSPGPYPMAYGLAWSINEVAAYIMKSFGPQGPQRFAEFLKQINIPTNVQPYPSMALGACELSLYEMLGAYTMFPTEGINTEPFYITRIEDKHGNVLDNFIPPHKEVLSQQTAYTMTRMMQGTVTSAPLKACANALAWPKWAERPAPPTITQICGSWAIPHSCSPAPGSAAMNGLSISKTDRPMAVISPGPSGNFSSPKPSPTNPSASTATPDSSGPTASTTICNSTTTANWINRCPREPKAPTRAMATQISTSIRQK